MLHPFRPPPPASLLRWQQMAQAPRQPRRALLRARVQSLLPPLPLQPSSKRRKRSALCCVASLIVPAFLAQSPFVVVCVCTCVCVCACVCMAPFGRGCARKGWKVTRLGLVSRCALLLCCAVLQLRTGETNTRSLLTTSELLARCRNSSTREVTCLLFHRQSDLRTQTTSR